MADHSVGLGSTRAPFWALEALTVTQLWMSAEPSRDISDADGHLQVAAERASESKPSVSDEHGEDSRDELLKDDTPTRVRDGLYIGSLEAARNYPHLRSQNITHVLQVPLLHLPCSPAPLPRLTTDAGTARSPGNLPCDADLAAGPHALDLRDRVHAYTPHGRCFVTQVASIEQKHHPGMEYMVVSVQDENSVDLVTHFVDCFAFIDRGRAAGARGTRARFPVLKGAGVELAVSLAPALGQAGGQQI